MTQPSRLPSRASEAHVLPPEHAAERPLTHKQRRFVEEYLVDMNAREAAIRAGYGARSAHAHGPYLANQPHIHAAISQALDERAERTRITADRVLIELARIAFSDIAGIVDWSENAVTVTPPKKLPRSVRAAIAEIQVIPTPDGVAAKVRLHSKSKALQALCRHLDLFGLFRAQNVVESPAKAADRARALILARLQAMSDARQREAETEDEGAESEREE